MAEQKKIEPMDPSKGTGAPTDARAAEDRKTLKQRKTLKARKTLKTRKTLLKPF